MIKSGKLFTDKEYGFVLLKIMSARNCIGEK